MKIPNMEGSGQDGRVSVEDAYYAMGGNPATFLRSFLALRSNPSCFSIGFDHNDLQWLVNVWNEAATISGGDHLMLRERDRYQSLCDNLKQGEFERKDSGYVFLDTPSDWPHPQTIAKAIHALEHAEIRTIQ